MGCTQSRIENEEAVTRCKERKQFMIAAVGARNAFAAAHSAYSMALKNTGAALSDYGQGEVDDLRPSQPPVPSTMDSLLPPPPPVPNISPLQRSATMPEFSIPKPDQKPSDPILEEDDDEATNDDEDSTNLRQRSSSRGGGRATTTAEAVAKAQPPPSPSFHSPPRTPPTPPSNRAPLSPRESRPEKEWDYFGFFGNVDEIPRTSLGDPQEIRPEKDENEGGVFDNRFKRTENVGVGNDEAVNVSSSSKVEEVEPPMPPEMVEPVVMPVKKAKRTGYPQSAPAEVKRGSKAAANVSLLEILIKLDDEFLKASESAHEVSKMLEANRLHYHSNFADNRGHIDHSARVMRVITWNRSFRGLPNADEGKDDFDAEEHETHATVLDKLLAWEKKLYDEVKAGELMKLEYQRKVNLLDKQKKRGSSTEGLEKTKAVVSHLHTRYIVDMQSLDSTVSEINHLRDDQLYPKLVALADGMATMWGLMSTQHHTQMKIVEDLRSLDISQSPEETSGEHYGRTVQLCGVVEEWHSQFVKLMTHQKAYIKALNSWLRLNLIPIESSLREKVASPPRVQNPPIQGLLHAWRDLLDKLPDELAKTAIFSFAAVMKTIILQQQEEMKLKEKCEETRKEYNRKERAFQDRYGKQPRSLTDATTDPESTENADIKDPAADSHFVDRQFALVMLNQRLEEEMEAHKKHCIQVREKSLLSLKMRLPELFRSMYDFALACSNMYMRLKSISQSEKNTENSS